MGGLDPLIPDHPASFDSHPATSDPLKAAAATALVAGEAAGQHVHGEVRERSDRQAVAKEDAGAEEPVVEAVADDHVTALEAQRTSHPHPLIPLPAD